MFKKQIQGLQFKFNILKLKYIRIKRVNHHLKTLKFCLYTMIKIGSPVTESEILVTTAATSVYIDTISELNRIVDDHRYRLDI